MLKPAEIFEPRRGVLFRSRKRGSFQKTKKLQRSVRLSPNWTCLPKRELCNFGEPQKEMFLGTRQRNILSPKGSFGF